jgi:predicted transcriptional regulator
MLNNEADLLALAAEVVTAYVGNNTVSPSDLPRVVEAVFKALKGNAGGEIEAEKIKPVPAVSVKKSIRPDFIVCLEDGKKFKSLKRHLRTSFDMSPEDYRAKWGLPADYPMVAPNYAASRSELAKKMGLGRPRKKAPAAKAPAAKTQTRKARGRRRAA